MVMSAEKICRLCLAINRPVFFMAHTPLQDVYEKLTKIPLKTPHRPVVACCVCYAQLRKCYNLMVRAVRADEVLTRILQKGEISEEEFIATINRYQPSDGLSVTPTKFIDMTSIEHSLIEIKEEPQCREEMETERRKLVDRFKFEESEDEGDIDRVEAEDVDDIDSDGLTTKEVKEEVLDDMDIEGQGLTGAVPSNIRAQTHEKTQTRRTTLTLDKKNIIGRPRKRRAVQQDTSSKLRRPKRTAHNIQVSRNVSVYSVDTRNKANISVNNDKECTGTNTDVDNSSREHLTETFISNDCGDVFDDKYLLIEHIEHHNVVNRTSDRTSGEESSHRRTLLRKQTCSRTGVVNKHTETRTRNNIFECHICQRKFMTKWNLNRHLRTHTGEKPFECEICQAKFNQKFNLSTHLRIHTGKKPFECEICHVTFNEKSNLKKHLRTHTGEKPFNCEKCQLKFNEKSNLKKHLRTHTGEEPFECKICNVKFTRKSHLERHLITHSGEKPFECNICHVKFTQISNLNRHLKTHTGEKPFACDVCEMKFYRKSYLKTHLRTHASEPLKPFQCETCREKFNNKFNFKTHLRTHTGERPFKCEICKVKFMQNAHLKKHIRTHTGERPYKCKICEVQFSDKFYLDTHLRIHTGEKPYECEVCKVKFNQKSHLNTHARIHTVKKH